MMSKKESGFLLEINQYTSAEIQKNVAKVYQLLQGDSIQKHMKNEAKRNLFRKATFVQKCKIIIKSILERSGNRRIHPMTTYSYFEEGFVDELQKITQNAILLKLSTYDLDNLSFRVQIDECDESLKNEISLFPKLVGKGPVVILVNSLDVGGMEQVVAHLSRGIKKQGIILEIWCLYSGGVVADELSCEGIRVRVFDGRKRLLYRQAKNNPPALINTHYIQLDLIPFRKMGIPVIEVVHNMYVVQHQKFWKLERSKYYACCKIVAVSELSKKTYLKKLNLLETDKVVVIGNSAEKKESSNTNRDKIRSGVNIKEDSFVFINVASMDSRKNQLSLIAAFDIIASLVDETPYLILIGNIIDEEYYRKIKRKIAECRYCDYIKLLPYTNNIQAMYEISDAFVMNSYYEGWSIAATEAIHAGLPIVHSECGSAVELTRQEKYGVMIPNPLSNINDMSPVELLHYMQQGIYCNLEELTIAMLRMINAKDELRKYRESIGKSAVNEFGQDRMVMEYLELFEQVSSTKIGIKPLRRM